jgi:cell filamentation protein
MTFDPFNDFETRGYLRNLLGENDPVIIKYLEHNRTAKMLRFFRHGYI